MVLTEVTGTGLHTGNSVRLYGYIGLGMARWVLSVPQAATKNTSPVGALGCPVDASPSSDAARFLR